MTQTTISPMSKPVTEATIAEINHEIDKFAKQWEITHGTYIPTFHIEEAVRRGIARAMRQHRGQE